MKLVIEQWVISYADKACEPLLVKENVKQATPFLTFKLNEVHFTVEFENQSDYMSAAYGTIVNAIVISANRSKRFTGTAVNRKI